MTTVPSLPPSTVVGHTPYLQRMPRQRSQTRLGRHARAHVPTSARSSSTSPRSLSPWQSLQPAHAFLILILKSPPSLPSLKATTLPSPSLYLVRLYSFIRLFCFEFQQCSTACKNVHRNRGICVQSPPLPLLPPPCLSQEPLLTVVYFYQSYYANKRLLL